MPAIAVKLLRPDRTCHTSYRSSIFRIAAKDREIAKAVGWIKYTRFATYGIRYDI